MCGTQDFGLNFHLPQKFLNFDYPVFLWTYPIEGHFSIFNNEKIDQKLLKFNIWRVFLGKSTTLNRVSISVFSSYFGRKILNFNYAIHQCFTISYRNEWYEIVDIPTEWRSLITCMNMHENSIRKHQMARKINC